MTFFKAGFLAILLSLALGGLSTASAAGRDAPDTTALARRWDHINFEIHDNALAQAEADRLEQQAEALARSNPDQAEPLIWEAAAILAKADARRTFASLSLADHARKLLERAVALGADGEDGAFAYAVLGTLYAEMPGFPLGFGDRRRARKWFDRAYSAAPDNIDVNVLLGSFLLHQHDAAGAAAAAKRALNARPRPEREIRDRYRREEALTLLEQAQRHSKP